MRTVYWGGFFGAICAPVIRAENFGAPFITGVPFIWGANPGVPFGGQPLDPKCRSHHPIVVCGTWFGWRWVDWPMPPYPVLCLPRPQKSPIMVIFAKSGTTPPNKRYAMSPHVINGTPGFAPQINGTPVINGAPKIFLPINGTLFYPLIKVRQRPKNFRPYKRSAPFIWGGGCPHFGHFLAILGIFGENGVLHTTLRGSSQRPPPQRMTQWGGGDFRTFFQKMGEFEGWNRVFREGPE